MRKLLLILVSSAGFLLVILYGFLIHLFECSGATSHGVQAQTVRDNYILIFIACAIPNILTFIFVCRIFYIKIMKKDMDRTVFIEEETEFEYQHGTNDFLIFRKSSSAAEYGYTFFRMQAGKISVGYANISLSEFTSTHEVIDSKGRLQGVQETEISQMDYLTKITVPVEYLSENDALNLKTGAINMNNALKIISKYKQ